ncbi:hypothetical protein SAMN04487818_11838 [Actinokineospora terrae]|uniref:Integrase catalytic domain-containing protein n=1 Tax=Actinokineospora terrae TaxID=155974 RepID=A0A1H9XQE9_9PSEU|nr:DDE-type integrase/transposase/recombinase [Actinokineospora terrae]SES47923.1 hypothetical protein SAMN04487818_11838 [Actinokineospora terrae]
MAAVGHWEGDLVIGKAGKTAVATLVERTSRFLILVPLTGRDSLTVTETIISAAGALPASLKRSLTWDRGSEIALNAEVTATGLPVCLRVVPGLSDLRRRTWRGHGERVCSNGSRTARTAPMVIIVCTTGPRRSW